MKALGILIGFAWEKGFDAAVESACDRMEEDFKIPDVVSKMFLSVCLCALVIPAWRDFFLPQIQELGLWQEEEEEDEEAAEDMGHDICLLRWCPFLKCCYRSTAVERQDNLDKETAKELKEKFLKETPTAKTERQDKAREKLEKAVAGHNKRAKIVEALKSTAREQAQVAQSVQDQLKHLLQELHEVKEALQPRV
jgi:hypothetical protein